MRLDYEFKDINNIKRDSLYSNLEEMDDMWKKIDEPQEAMEIHMERGINLMRA